MPDRTSSEVSFRVSSRKRVQGKWIPHVKVCVGSSEKGKYKTRVSSSMNRTVGRKIIGRHVVTGESLRESFFHKEQESGFRTVPVSAGLHSVSKVYWTEYLLVREASSRETSLSCFWIRDFDLIPHSSPVYFVVHHSPFLLSWLSWKKNL